MSIKLTQRCNAASQSGADFPTIWTSILKPSGLVVGLPAQVDLGRLEIMLVSRRRIIYNSETRTFRLE